MFGFLAWATYGLCSLANSSWHRVENERRRQIAKEKNELYYIASDTAYRLVEDNSKCKITLNCIDHLCVFDRYNHQLYDLDEERFLNAVKKAEEDKKEYFRFQFRECKESYVVETKTKHIVVPVLRQKEHSIHSDFCILHYKDWTWVGPIKEIVEDINLSNIFDHYGTFLEKVDITKWEEIENVRF